MRARGTDTGGWPAPQPPSRSHRREATPLLLSYGTRRGGSGITRARPLFARALARRLTLRGGYPFAVPPGSTLPATFASASANATSASTPRLLASTSSV